MKKLMRKGFTLVEMLVVILIIGILAVVLLPQLMGMVEGSKDLAPMSAARNLVASLTGTSYPPHLESFSKKEHRIPNESQMADQFGIKSMEGVWGNGSWNVLWNPTEFRDGDTDTKSYKFGHQVLRQVSEDVLSEQWSSRDDQTILMGFVGHLGKIVDGIEGGDKDDTMQTLKIIFPYIDETDVSNNKMDWAFYVGWLQKTDKSGSVKVDSINFPEIVASNPEMEGIFFNMFTYVKGGRILTLGDLLPDPYQKRAFVKQFLKMIDTNHNETIVEFSAGI